MWLRVRLAAICMTGPLVFGTALVCSLKTACQEVWRGLVCSLHAPHLTCQPWLNADPHMCTVRWVLVWRES
ncbi:hypothetical protein J3E72DRAFT_355507 [Bipolaris maydis]|nr:hypothetical protein J3E72DRAFT_355507 [Bipolaris maydis]